MTKNPTFSLGQILKEICWTKRFLAGTSAGLTIALVSILSGVIIEDINTNANQIDELESKVDSFPVERLTSSIDRLDSAITKINQKIDYDKQYFETQFDATSNQIAELRILICKDSKGISC